MEITSPTRAWCGFRLARSSTGAAGGRRGRGFFEKLHQHHHQQGSQNADQRKRDRAHPGLRLGFLAGLLAGRDNGRAGLASSLGM